MSKSVNLNLEVDEELIQKAERIFSKNGLRIADAFNLLLEYSALTEDFPSELLEIPNAETLAAIDDVNHGRNLSKTFSSIEELMEDLNA